MKHREAIRGPLDGSNLAMKADRVRVVEHRASGTIQYAECYDQIAAAYKTIGYYVASRQDNEAALWQPTLSHPETQTNG